MDLTNVPTDVLLRQIQERLPPQKDNEVLAELQRRGVVNVRQFGIVNRSVKQHGINEYRGDKQRPVVGDKTFEPVNYENMKYVRKSPLVNRNNILNLN